VLERNFSERVANEPELLAHHYTQAGNLAAAIPSWQKAGELALARVALREAVGHFEKGLALIERLPPSSERDRLELSIREPLNVAWIGLRGWATTQVGVNAAASLELAKSQGRTQSLLVGLWGCGSHPAQGIADTPQWLSAGCLPREQQGRGISRSTNLGQCNCHDVPSPSGSPARRARA
jgi:hypothetical protein